MLYLGTNIILNFLNYYWFGRMIDAVRKRFAPKGERVKGKGGEGEGGKGGEEAEVLVVVEGTEIKLDGKMVKKEL